MQDDNIENVSRQEMGPADARIEATQPQGQPTVILQQVKSVKDLNGLGGWLMFFLICFAISGLSFISTSIFSIFTPTNSALGIITAIFAPIMAALALVSAVFIALQFKISRFTAIAVYGVGAVFSALMTFAAIGETEGIINGLVWGTAVVGVLTMLIVYALLSLYFIVSKRVKETLVKELPKNILIIVTSTAGGVALLLVILGLIFSLTAKKPDITGLNGDNDYSDYNYDDSDDDDDMVVKPNQITKNINQTIVDSDLGYTVKIGKAILNIPFDDEYYYSNYKSVAVEVSVENNSSYYGSFSSYNLSLIVNGSEASVGNYYFENYIEDNDLMTLPYSTARGSSSKGWMFFTYDKDIRGDVVLVYDREAKTTSDDKTLTAKRVEIKIN